MPECKSEHNLRPRKKRRTPVHRPEGYHIEIRLPKDINKAFRVSNKQFCDAMFKCYGQIGSQEGCSGTETGGISEQEQLTEGFKGSPGSERSL